METSRWRKRKLAVLGGVPVGREKSREEHGDVKSCEQDGARHEFLTMLHDLTPRESADPLQREARLPADFPR